MQEVAPGVVVFVHSEGRSNCGMVFTTDGVVLVDTTARPVDIQAYLTLAGISPRDVCLILITHSHSDHTSGIPLFDCPVLAHKLTRQRIAKRGTERSKKQIPTEVFENRKDMIFGGVRLEVIHAGGHTPGSSVVWLPEPRVLFVGDLIFEGRYPFLATANVPQLMETLRWIPSFGARVIVPGHGVLCGDEEVIRQLEYIESTWARTAEHIALGHSLEEVLNDPDFPCCAELGFERLHGWNIKVIYQQLRKRSG
ncbi:MAG: MBL fold metallo-hydrolase [Anaerolineales bacterium]